MQITGTFNLSHATDDNPAAYTEYKNAVGVVESQFDCETEIQGYIAIYSNRALTDRIFRFPVLILKPENDSDADMALLTEAIRVVCIDMQISEITYEN